MPFDKEECSSRLQVLKSGQWILMLWILLTISPSPSFDPDTDNIPFIEEVRKIIEKGALEVIKDIWSPTAISSWCIRQLVVKG